MMNLKKTLLIPIFISLFVNMFGQKVKVKDEVLFINKQDVGFFVKKKIYGLAKQYAIINKKKDTVLKVGYEVIFSPIDGEDEVYSHTILSIPTENFKITYPIRKGYGFRPKKIIRHFISIGLIDEELNLDKSIIEELKQDYEEYPEEMTEMIEKEKGEIHSLDYIVDKINDGRVYLKKTETTSEVIKYLFEKNLYYFDTYEVYLQNENEELQIGKIVIRYPLASMTLSGLGTEQGNKMSGDLSKAIILVYNLKGGRVARLGEAPFEKLVVYKENLFIDRKEHSFFKEKSILTRATKLVDWLIKFKNI